MSDVSIIGKILQQIRGYFNGQAGIYFILAAMKLPIIVITNQFIQI